MRRAALGAAALLAMAALAAGCGTSAGSPHINGATVQQSSAPAPVSTAATLIGNCVMGYEWTPNTTNAASGVFIAGPPPAGNSSGDPALAYRLTLNSTSANTASVTGFAVAFYDASGVEAGSDQESASGFITPGQSLAWTVIEDATVHGYGDDPNEQITQTGAIPASAATCQLVQWSP